MTIQHHPSEETLTSFVTGRLCEGNSLVVATHLAHCTECRQTVDIITEASGTLIEAAAADAAAVSEIGPAARDAVLARLDETLIDEQPVTTTIAATARPMAPLSLYEGGKWQWVGPGVYRQFIDVPSDSGTRVFMLKAAPGTRLPDHRHVGTEWTCVIKGAFSHDHGRFGAGDFDEADGNVDHNPYVEKGEECICLVALNGHVEMTGWLGRFIQPLVRL
ncbi:MAG: cupin domain-containing protein [Hyphomicrobiaceae bacterium]